MSQSTTWISFDNLFRIRPIGTLSKNSFIGANIKEVIIRLWRIRLVFKEQYSVMATLKIANAPYENEIIENIDK